MHKPVETMFKIDPFAKTVSAVAPLTFNQMRTGVGCAYLQPVFLCLRTGVCLVVNEEGLIDDSPKAFFTIRGCPDMLCGIAYLCKLSPEDEEPTPFATGVTAAYVRKLVVWRDVVFEGFVETTEVIPVPGKNSPEFTVFMATPVFRQKEPKS
jgi:hypothetical protein